MTNQVPICADCISGSIHEGTPKGRTATLHGLDTYISEPPDGRPPKGLVVMMPDIYGWELTNARVLADVYAEKGPLLVYLPDFSAGFLCRVGRSVPSRVMLLVDRINQAQGFWRFLLKISLYIKTFSHFIPFLTRNYQSILLPRITAFLRSVRDGEGQALKIGAAGFCFGGRYAVLLTHNDKETSTVAGGPLIDAVFTGHPSQLDIPRDIEKVKLPLSIAVGSLDSWMPMEHVEETKKLLDHVSVEYEVVVYEGAKHGFTVRGAPGDEAEIKRGVQAEDQAVSWFTRLLGPA
ncbi:MAG: hypothetical protein M1840_008618 [Geoglossum simile]|nr:MAG: hypothetical protein M1840_008618 [Geoglossum simile]